MEKCAKLTSKGTTLFFVLLVHVFSTPLFTKNAPAVLKKLPCQTILHGPDGFVRNAG